MPFEQFDLGKAATDAERIKIMRNQNALAEFSLGNTRQFNALAPQIAGGDYAAYQEGMGVDPTSTLAIRKAGAAQESDSAVQFARLAKFVLDQPPEARPQAWQNARAEAGNIFGVDISKVPEEYDEGKLQAIYARAVDPKAVTAVSGPGKVAADITAGFLPEGTPLRAPKGPGVTVNLPGKPQIGTIPPGYQAIEGPGGAWRMEPIAGGPAEAKIGAAEVAAETKRKLKTTQADIVTEDIDRSIAMVESASLPVTGMGSFLSSIPGTAAHDLSATIDTVKANIGFDKLQAMREASPTGGALGQVSEMENKLLQSVYGNLSQSQSKEEFLYNMRRLKDTYLDVVHGPGNRPDSQQPGGEFAGISDEDFASVPLTADNAAAWMEEAKRRGLMQ